MKTARILNILFCVTCFACLSCQRGRPARKELPPSLSSLPEIGSTVTPFPSRWSLVPQASTNFLFYCTDTSFLIDGLRHDFLVLAIPDQSHDSIIGALVSAGFSMAPFLLAQLHQLNKAGVVIDLRLSDAGPTVRQDYQVTGSFLKETHLPIVFLWDRDAAGRAAFFSQFLEQLPGITWSITRDRPRYQSDCFKDVHPSF
jgi:hypothetical protein